ncbi:MAG: diguanylate cyclase domain-containing protein [Steroidobacteraceae bacterium]
MRPTHLNLADFPDSAYVQELRDGAPAQRFAAPLEAEYTHWHLRRVRRRLKAWFALNLALVAFFIVAEWPRGQPWNVFTFLQLGVLLPCTAALAWLPWSRQYERLFAPAGHALVTVFYVIIGGFLALALSADQVEQLAIMTVDLLAVFFFSGLMFRQASLTTVATLLAFAVAAVLFKLPHLLFLKSMVVLTLTGIIGAIVYWDVEQSYRGSFLEAALIKDLVARDALCGLMNRRAFDEYLPRVWQQALREQRTLAVLMIDFDRFKQYNDIGGHQAGDAALRSVARVIQDFARRPLDLAARYGGEEFIVVLYGVTLEHLRDTAEGLRQAVQNLQIRPADTARGGVAEVTVSIGAGLVTPSIDRTPVGAVQLADEALYEAKRAGRNCVVVKGIEDYRVLQTGAFKTSASASRRG